MPGLEGKLKKHSPGRPDSQIPLKAHMEAPAPQLKQALLDWVIREEPLLGPCKTESVGKFQTCGFQSGLTSTLECTSECQLTECYVAALY